MRDREDINGIPNHTCGVLTKCRPQAVDAVNSKLCSFRQSSHPYPWSTSCKVRSCCSWMMFGEMVPLDRAVTPGALIVAGFKETVVICQFSQETPFQKQGASLRPFSACGPQDCAPQGSTSAGHPLASCCSGDRKSVRANSCKAYTSVASVEVCSGRLTRAASGKAWTPGCRVPTSSITTNLAQL